MTSAVETSPDLLQAPETSVEPQKVIAIDGLSEDQRLLLHATLLASPKGISVQVNHLHELAPEQVVLTLDSVEAVIAGLSAKQREIVLRRLQQLTSV